MSPDPIPVVLTTDDILVLLHLAAVIDPATISGSGGKAMIYRCKALAEQAKAEPERKMKLTWNAG